MKIPISLLGNISDRYSLAYINNTQSLDQASYLPFLNEDFVEVNKNILFASPTYVKIKTVANEAVVYWSAPPATKGIRAIVQRSENGGDYETIYTSFKAHQFAYTDNHLEIGMNYQYRVCFTDGRNYTIFTPSETVNLSGEGKKYADIIIDGLSEDWNIIEPIITGNSLGITAFCFFNTKDLFYFSLEADEISNYQIFLSENNDLHYKISNDSLYTYSETGWQYLAITYVEKTTSFIEGSIDYSLLFDETITSIYFQVNINGQMMMNETIYSFKYNIINTPENFQLIPSVSNPYTSIKLKWKPNSKTDGYIIQRSIGDSVHFETIKDLNPNGFYYMDQNLDSAQIYYYRIFTFRGIIRSPYTAVQWLQPNGSSLLDEYQTAINVYPNPAKDYIKIDLYSFATQGVKLNILDNNGKSIQELFSGMVSGQKIIPFQLELSKGVYIIQLRGKKTIIRKKLIII